DGYPAKGAMFNGPTRIAFDHSGNMIIADGGNHVVREINTQTDIITTIAGNGFNGYSGDGGAAISAQLSDPIGVAVDPTGNIYISDANADVVRMVDFSGNIYTVAGNGTFGY